MARYYRLDEANARLAELRPLLEKLREDRNAVAELQQKIRDVRSNNGSADHALGKFHDKDASSRFQRLFRSMA